MKYFKLLIISIFVFFISITTVLASSSTYTRTKNKPLVPKDVKVTDDNISEILKTPAVSSKEKIYDFADIYTDDEETKLYDKVVQYMNLADVDLAIVTTSTLNRFKDAEEYASKFYDYNDFKKNGVILVVYMHDNGFSLYMDIAGNDAEFKKVYTDDNRIDDTLKYVTKFFSQKDYYTGTDKYIGLLKGYYNKYGPSKSEVDEDGNAVKNIPIIEIIVISIALTFIVVVLLFYKLKDNNKKDEKDVLEGKIDSSTLTVKIIKDEIINDKK